jgi:serine/threonine protein kinase
MPRMRSSLRAELNRGSSMNMAQRLVWAAEIAGAVAFCHAEGIVHADLKVGGADRVFMHGPQDGRGGEDQAMPDICRV